MRSRVPDALRRAAAIVFALAFLVAGIGASALLWSRDRSYYAAFAGETLREQRFHGVPGFGVSRVLDVDDGTRRYVLCECADEKLLERVPGFYGAREKGHLRQVQGVIAGVRRATVLASLLLLVGLILDRRALRRIVLAEAALVVLVGSVAALAFEPAFLLFHQVFFPQGNFLFDPATDNIVLLYPEAYWLGVTLRVGVTFLVVALGAGALASLSIRFRGDQRGGGTVGT